MNQNSNKPTSTANNDSSSTPNVDKNERDDLKEPKVQFNSSKDKESGCNESIQEEKVLLDDVEYLNNITRRNIHFSMPPSLYGHIFNEVMLAGNKARTIVFWLKFWAFCLVQMLQFGILIFLYVGLVDESKECRADNMLIRMMMLGSSFVVVIPSSRDFVNKFFAIQFYNYAIVDDGNNVKVLKNLTKGKNLIDRAIIWAATTTILAVEFIMWITVIGCAVRSILSAKSTAEIIFCRIKIALIHEIDSLFYRQLVPETVRGSKSKQLFLRRDSFGKKGISTSLVASLRFILSEFLHFLQKFLSLIRVLVVVGGFIVLFELYEICYHQYQWLP
eukprot:gene38850-52474_t